MDRDIDQEARMLAEERLQALEKYHRKLGHEPLSDNERRGIRIKMILHLRDGLATGAVS